MNFLSLFVLVPLLMMLGLWVARNVNQVRGVMVAGASALLVLAVTLAVLYLRERAGGATAEMLFGYGFAGSASWSDEEAVRSYNKRAVRPMTHSVMLNFMASYGRKRGGTYQ